MKIAKFVHLIFTLFQKLFNIWNKAPDFNEMIVLALENIAIVLNDRTLHTSLKMWKLYNML